MVRDSGSSILLVFLWAASLLSTSSWCFWKDRVASSSEVRRGLGVGTGRLFVGRGADGVDADWIEGGKRESVSIPAVGGVSDLGFWGLGDGVTRYRGGVCG